MELVASPPELVGSRRSHLPAPCRSCLLGRRLGWYGNVNGVVVCAVVVVVCGVRVVVGGCLWGVWWCVCVCVCVWWGGEGAMLKPYT